MPIEVIGLDSLGGLEALVMDRLDSPAALAPFQALGNAVADTARGYAPEYEGPAEKDVVRGLLKDEIRSRATRESGGGAPVVYVSVPWDYGGFIEFGTEHNSAHPFMRPAASLWEGQVEGYITPYYQELFS